MTMVSSISGETKTDGEAGVAALGGVVGRDTNEAMDAGFPGEQPKGEVAGDGEGSGFDAGLVAILDFVDLDFEVLALAPADVHAHEHLGPILRLCTARAGVHNDDGVEHVRLAREHGAGFELFGVFDQGGNLAFEIGLRGFAFAGQFEVGFDVVCAAGKLCFVGEQGFQALAFAHQRL